MRRAGPAETRREQDPQVLSALKTSSRILCSCVGKKRILLLFFSSFFFSDATDLHHVLRLLRFGEFAVNMVYQTTNNILMSTCQVQDLEWPIAKDAPIIRVGRRSFTFALPGLLYGVQFPPPCKDSCMDILEKVFLKYSDYCNLLCEGTQGKQLTANAFGDTLNHTYIIRQIYHLSMSLNYRFQK